MDMDQKQPSMNMRISQVGLIEKNILSTTKILYQVNRLLQVEGRFGVLKYPSD